MSRPLVIICTYNPRREFLGETLGALRGQSLPLAEWDLMLIDNASTPPLRDWVDLSWHPSAHIVREEKVGVAHARHRAMREARVLGTDLILFVDDDNILHRDYLAAGLAIASDWPKLGAWGGQLLPRYAVNPPGWIKNYLGYLAIFPLSTDLWCNQVKSYDMVPPTAGCFLRAAVWERYLELIEQDPRRLGLARAEDMDLVLTAIDLGLGIGRFRDLQLTHIVPANRLTPAYITNLVEGTMVGMAMMEYIRYRRAPRPLARGLVERALLHWRAARLPEPIRSIRRAEIRGRAAACRIVHAWQTSAAASQTANLETMPATA